MPPPSIAPQPALLAARQPLASSSSRTEERPVLRTSKEWIVPPRPKPGRKPAADPTSQGGKKATNRASQRAFRERKQEHISELEEKVRQLEQGEGEKAVFFQQQALRAKDESTLLRRENDALRTMINDLRKELAVYRSPPAFIDAEDETSSVGPSTRRRKRDAAAPPAKRPRRGEAVDASTSSEPHSTKDERTSSTSSIAPIIDRGDSPKELACGLCSQDGSCFCAEVGFNIDPASKAIANSSAILSSMGTAATDSLMGNDLETWQPAVPLKFRRSGKTAAKPPIWKLDAVSSTKSVLCSGDPADCPACSNDPFGKAFCDALSKSVCSSNPCASCPNGTHPPSSSAVADLPSIEITDESSLFEDMVTLPCCGDPAACGSKSCTAEEVSRAEWLDEMLPRSVLPGVRTAETVPCNEAWTALKEHPNIAFANLQLLADVVAKRTHCDGPTVAERTASPSPGPSSSFATPTLVPHQTLLCASDAGKRKRLTVERFAVNEALNILDRAVGRGGPFEPQSSPSSFK